MRFFAPLLRFVFHLGYLGPLVMGTMDSSFLILPFGNDLVVASLVIHHPHGVPWYVLSAACGSSIGAFLLVLVARKLGEERLRAAIGTKKHKMLQAWVEKHAGLAIAISGLAPPPFPFTTVIAATGAMQYPVGRILVINFCARLVRFLILAALAIKFGKEILYIARSATFEYAMIAFTAVCVVASVYSAWKWLKKPRRGRAARQATAT